MANFHDIQIAIRTVLESGQAEVVAQSIAGKPITVLIGDRNKVPPEAFPVVIIIHKPGPRTEGSHLFDIEDDYVLDIGVRHADPETAIAHLAELDSAVMNDLRANRTLGGLITDMVFGQPIGDLGTNHPSHFMAEKIKTSRKQESL